MSLKDLMRKCLEFFQYDVNVLLELLVMYIDKPIHLVYFCEYISWKNKSGFLFILREQLSMNMMYMSQTLTYVYVTIP